ncbi:hypothetical protein GCM10022226_40340 [Sphaerisporangium flaviroseum]|uniref:non-specific serine/threonine protein kinase n=2 Tax=Sphaerisporangium flaviroseum TaxID=509199 RepID=A0ABP7IDB7_9ACTN
MPAHLTGPEREVLLERTMREARLTARLNHPNIAAVYDVVQADDRPWIVLQFVRSRSLAEVIADEGPLPVSTVTRVGLEVLSALEAAHAVGVMHRDVKPANILLTEEGHAVLTDFGLATSLDEEASLTRVGMVMGTPAYIAPERAGGAASSAESDLWSLGATLYAAAEGRPPFDRSTALATLTAVQTAAPEPFQCAGPLAPVIAGLLDKDPARRTGAVRAQEQLRDVAALEERTAGGSAAPLPAARPVPPGTTQSTAQGPGIGHRPTGEQVLGDRRSIPVRQRVTWRRGLSTCAAGLAVGIVVFTTATTEWRGGRPEPGTPSIAVQPESRAPSIAVESVTGHDPTPAPARPRQAGATPGTGTIETGDDRARTRVREPERKPVKNKPNPPGKSRGNGKNGQP